MPTGANCGRLRGDGLPSCNEFYVVCSYAHVLNVIHKSYSFINVDKTPFVIDENSL